jgi:hypothetical protein
MDLRRELRQEHRRISMDLRRELRQEHRRQLDLEDLASAEARRHHRFHVRDEPRGRADAIHTMIHIHSGAACDALWHRNGHRVQRMWRAFTPMWLAFTPRGRHRVQRMWRASGRWSHSRPWRG